MCALAVLPSLTDTSGASLLTGTLATGAMRAEKSGFADAFRGAPLFHKDDLRSTAGAQLPSAVVGAIASTQDQAGCWGSHQHHRRHLHKQDPSSTRWTLDRLAPLRALLHEARSAGRTVVLTADHGHVIERASEARSVPGASAGGGRPRPAPSPTVRCWSPALGCWHRAARRCCSGVRTSTTELARPVTTAERPWPKSPCR